MSKSADLLAALKSSSVARVSALQEQMTGAQSEVTAFDEFAAQNELDSKEQADLAYDQGVKDTQAANGNPDGKLYSLEEANAMIAEAVLPLNGQISDLSLKMADLQAKVDAMPDLESAKLEAVESFKADMLGKYKSQQVAETEGETGFESSLQPAVVGPLRKASKK